MTEWITWRDVSSDAPAGEVLGEQPTACPQLLLLRARALASLKAELETGAGGYTDDDLAACIPLVAAANAAAVARATAC